MISWYNFVNIQCLRYLRYNFYSWLNFNLMSNNFLFLVGDCNKFINHSINCFFNLNIDILNDLNLYYSLLNHRNLDLSLNLTNNYLLYFFFNYFLYYLRYFNYFFYDSRNYHNLFNNLFYFNNFRHFNHLLNDLFNFNSDFFDTVHITRNFNDSLFDVSHWLWHLYVMINYFLYFNQLRLIDNHRVS